MNFSRTKLFDTAFKMDKDKKTVGSLSSGDFESNVLMKQGRGRSLDVIINNFSNELRRCLGKEVMSNFGHHLSRTYRKNGHFFLYNK